MVRPLPSKLVVISFTVKEFLILKILKFFTKLINLCCTLFAARKICIKHYHITQAKSESAGTVMQRSSV